MKKIAVVLSGCGFKDGAEITEAVSTLISLSQHHVEYKVFAPNIEAETLDHVTGETIENRNVLKESARIARGDIKDLQELKSGDFDAVVFPGGFGAAKNLCDFASKGADCKVNLDVERVINDFYNSQKPIGAWCIAPALVARVLGSYNIAVTIGNDKDTALEIEKTGAQHVECTVDDYVTDRENKIITSPAYMYDDTPYKVFTGINKALSELVEMA
ncbi:MAG: isoprenoid biosynthesis glyoxalase ElbB [Bdellovibrionales bacterium]|nr:isoprenoid biosynthesis glyoxalase ElbB [Bdellovibrionales bacterium]